MITESTKQIAAKLSMASAKVQRYTFNHFNWDLPIKIGIDKCFTDELISIYGTHYWDTLSEEKRIELGFYEAINFFSMNIHGERGLISDISKILYYDLPFEIYEYLQHFIQEENQHMYMFSKFCETYNGGSYPEKSINLGQEDGHLAMVMLFLRIMIFEEIVDYYNLAMSKDESIHPTSREINRIHHVEESRHLNFGREFTRDLISELKAEHGETVLDEISEKVSSFLKMTWMQLYNPDIYSKVGIDKGFFVYQDLLESNTKKHFRDVTISRFLEFLSSCEITIQTV